MRRVHAFEMELKNIKTMLFAIIVIDILFGASAMPTANNNDDPVTINDDVTPYPFTQRRFVDLSYVSPEVSNMIQRSNLNIEQIRQQQDRLRDRYELITSSTPQPTILSENDEDYRIAKIQSELQATLRDPVADQGINRGDKTTSPSFEYAFPAVCEMPKSMNYSDWFGQKSWNIIFKPIYRHYNVQSSILRIYKINKEEFKSVSNECNEDINDLFTIKVSVYAKKKSKEFIKKAIHESLIPSKRIGWIEFDVISTLKFWNLPRNNYGISIDVFNEKNEQLDAHEYFELQNCADEAAPIIPWRAIEFLAKQSSPNESVPASVLEQLRKMYPYPRLDIMSSTPEIKNTQHYSSEEQATQLRRNANRSQRHIRHNHHYSLMNEHHVSVDNLVASLKSKSHKRRAHISRDDNGTAGDT